MDQAASGAVGTRAAAVVTLVFGCALVFVVGFAHATTLHNAGHDTRHAMAFPCH
ncbi:CbtB-domain containing protein [Acuticoccus sp. 2012]|uniref:CbtB-domain containing protein n=2 Tax=Acuticoccus mangrovi TaxID=2796142 RepID=A0A934MLF7_9HYPH|nr:CbtB-domain containing protein [Acuticoccus mangrovi]